METKPVTEMVLTEIDGRTDVATLTLNRPEARNPTSIAMLDAMDRGLDLIEATVGVRVVIVRGAGPAFCAGLDLDEVMGDEATIRTLLRRLSEVMRRLRRLDAVTIAHVQRAAIGGGFGFVVVCDFAVTHPEAKIGYPPLDVPLSPALMAPWLVRKIGPSRARAMLMAGGTITGAAAYEAGIVTHLAPEGDLATTVERLGDGLRAGGRYAAVAMKTFLNELDESHLDIVLDRAATVSADVIACDESQERLREILGDRAPHGAG